MAEIVNLNRFRKAKAKTENSRAAETNRVRFGRSKAEREAERLRREKLDRDLDGAKLEE